ncbi:hypothetical protein ZIOFF_020823 [Zingiber officinale]|uniref:Reverse transcriptase Ty1/copia-type domain-containing protein n=1 Tax=Zingiber officinale TaxID=94328 RepID=A0A8J5HJ29_ZINOF|nr:hypothetical protein ZIOFF_020823 [Zingiber officinale]
MHVHVKQPYGVQGAGTPGTPGTGGVNGSGGRRDGIGGGRAEGMDSGGKGIGGRIDGSGGKVMGGKGGANNEEKVPKFMVVDTFDTDKVILAANIEVGAEDVTTPTIGVVPMTRASSPSTPSSNTHAASSPSITNSPESYEGPVCFRSIADIYTNTEEVVGIDEEEGEVMMMIFEEPTCYQEAATEACWQSAYAKKILSQFKMTDCNAINHPMEFKTHLHKDLEGTPVDATEYMCIIGCLRYLLHTRPGLSYSVRMSSRYMERPTIMHHKEIGVFGYLDSDLAGDLDGRKNTSGMVVYFKFMAATTMACHALWLRSLANELTGVKSKPDEVRDFKWSRAVARHMIDDIRFPAAPTMSAVEEPTFLLYFKGMVSEHLSNGRLVHLVAIAAIVCDPSGNLLLKIQKPVSIADVGTYRKVVETAALIEGLNFSIYSKDIETSLGYDQSTLTTISFFKDFSANVAPVSSTRSCCRGSSSPLALL